MYPNAYEVNKLHGGSNLCCWGVQNSDVLPIEILALSGKQFLALYY